MKNTRGFLSVPVAILLAGVIVAGAIIYAVGLKATPETTGAGDGPEEISGEVKNVRDVSEKDHIRGNPKAPVKIIEFSDLECPFCKRFHSTMQQAMREYPEQVAWVYRHFPLDSLHPKARAEAEATECANELGGNDKFWAYVDRLFEITPSNNGLDLDLLPKIAEDVGLDKAKFETCLKSGKYKQRIQEDLDDAIASGGQGTPYSVIVTAKGEKIPFSGAQPYEALKQMIELALKK